MAEALLEVTATDFLRPNIDHLITEDDEPVDNIFSEKQQRLLTDPLFSSWPGSSEGKRAYVAFANVGLFYTVHQQAVVPDAMLSMDVEQPQEVWEKHHRSYFIWEYGKPPDVVIEVVSNRKGGEDTTKLRLYAQIGVPFYVIYDPEQQLSERILRVYGRNGGGYREMIDSYFPEIGLGVCLWEGVYQQMHAVWLRWCKRDLTPIPTGAEAARQAEEAARQAEERAERLAAQLRALGVEPQE